MYVPPAFAETRLDVLGELIGLHPFALLVTCGSVGPEATHLPMVLAERDGARALRGHLARANPHWRSLRAPVPALAVFRGEAVYVSPSWYPTKAETGKVVPTWNYEAVHVRGTARAVEDDAWLAAHVADLTAHLERDREPPWSVEDAPADFTAALRRGIVGVEIAVEEIVGKVKASQNRPEADRRGVVEALDGLGPSAVRLARRVRETL